MVTPADTGQIKHLIHSARFWPYISPDSAIHYADLSIELSKKIEYQYGEANGNFLKAEAYLYKGDYASGLYYNRLATEVFTADEKSLEFAYCEGQKGAFFSELGDFGRAISFITKHKSIVFSLGDSVYNRMTEEVENTYRMKASRSYEVAKIFLAAKITDSALYYARIVDELNQKMDHTWSAMPVLYGDIYFLKKDYVHALASYRLPVKENYVMDSAKNFLGRAKVYRQLSNEDSAIFYAEKAYTIFSTIRFSKGIMEASELLSQIFERKDLAESNRFYKISNALKDSLYSKEKINQVNSILFNEELRRLDIIAAEKAARNRFRIWSLFGGLFTMIVAGILLWINIQHKKSANKLLQTEKKNVEHALEHLKATQAQLIQSEKMASLGEITSGIAHEIQNPLNFVNNFSEINKELSSELEEKLEKGNYADAKLLAKDIRENEEKISHHGKRADAIVKNMLQHSITTAGLKEYVNISALADEFLGIAYHAFQAGFRSKDNSVSVGATAQAGFHATTIKDFDKTIGKINIIPQDIGRVLLNLFNNAFYAVSEKQKQVATGYEPTVSVITQRKANQVEIRVKDNGNGIPEKFIDKIFQPFFTTKPTGRGTGLGLSMAYDIVKAHGGELKVTSIEGQGSEFTIILNSN